MAMNYHLVARTHSCRGDFRAALQSEKEAYAIYKQTVSKSNISCIICTFVILYFSVLTNHFSVAKNKQAENDLVIVCCFNLLKSQKKENLPPHPQKSLCGIQVQ